MALALSEQREHDNVGQLLRAHDSPDWRQHLGGQFLSLRFGGDSAGIDTVHQDTMLTEIVRKKFTFATGALATPLAAAV